MPPIHDLWIKHSNGQTVSIQAYTEQYTDPENEFDLKRIESLREQGLLEPVHLHHVCAAPKMKNTIEAFELVRHLRYRIAVWAFQLQELHYLDSAIDNCCASFHNKLIEYSGFAAVRVKLALRAAFRKLEFRCLRKAFAPGNRGCKRLRDAFKDDFQEL